MPELSDLEYRSTPMKHPTSRRLCRRARRSAAVLLAIRRRSQFVRRPGQPGRPSTVTIVVAAAPRPLFARSAASAADSCTSRPVGGTRLSRPPSGLSSGIRPRRDRHDARREPRDERQPQAMPRERVRQYEPLSEVAHGGSLPAVRRFRHGSPSGASLAARALATMQPVPGSDFVKPGSLAHTAHLRRLRAAVTRTPAAMR